MNITLTNALTTKLAIDVKFDSVRRINEFLSPGESLVLGDVYTLDELERDNTIGALLAAGSLTATVTQDTYPVEVIKVAYTAGTTGAADDITIFAGLPYAVEILDAVLFVTTAASGETITLRTATGGTGTALSSAMSVASAVKVRDAGTSAGLPSVAKGGNIYGRRSDRATAGTAVVYLRRVV